MAKINDIPCPSLSTSLFQDKLDHICTSAGGTHLFFSPPLVAFPVLGHINVAAITYPPSPLPHVFLTRFIFYLIFAFQLFNNYSFSLM